MNKTGVYVPSSESAIVGFPEGMKVVRLDVPGLQRNPGTIPQFAMGSYGLHVPASDAGMESPIDMLIVGVLSTQADVLAIETRLSWLDEVLESIRVYQPSCILLMKPFSDECLPVIREDVGYRWTTLQVSGPVRESDHPISSTFLVGWSLCEKSQRQGYQELPSLVEATIMQGECFSIEEGEIHQRQTYDVLRCLAQCLLSDERGVS